MANLKSTVSECSSNHHAVQLEAHEVHVVVATTSACVDPTYSIYVLWVTNPVKNQAETGYKRCYGCIQS